MEVATLNRASAADQVIEEYDDGDDQKDVDQTPCDLENHPSEEPGNDQNDGEPYHGNPPVSRPEKGGNQSGD